MSGGRVQLRLLIFVFVISLTPCLAAQTHHKVKKLDPVITPVAPVVVPLTPAQMPAAPPTVSFSRGQLTISAPNSTLGDILREVRTQTGASIDVPGNATERVMGVFGPGPARDVLSTLLNGSHFNYVLLGSVTNPSGLDRVMLLSKPAAEPVNQVANAQNAPPQAPAAGVQAGEAMEFGNEQQGDNQQDSADIFGSAEEQPDQAQQADDQQQGGQPNPFGNPGNQVKTPQQLLQELQQQQQQGQQNPNGIPNPGAPRFGPGMPGMPPQPNPQ
jgi:hypothetical protein